MNAVLLTPLTGPVDATVSIPGSKSYTNRALIMAALTPGAVRILNPLASDDTEAMLGCLQMLGIRTLVHEDSIEVIGDISDIRDRSYELNVRLSGTTMRFMLALTSVSPGVQTLCGEGRLNERPIGDLVDGLRQCGADIAYLDAEGYPPVRVSTSKLSSGIVRMGGGVSSQYFSALLMVAPLVGGDMTIEVVGEQISKPYINMTIDGMRRFGVEVTNEKYRRYHVAGGQTYRAGEYVVEGDASSASYFAAIAALTHSRITLTGVNPRSLQADMRFFKILERMGAVITPQNDAVVVEGRGVQALEADMVDCPDQAQTLAVLAAFADGVTNITGVRSLRIKETERVQALQAELAKMAIKTESTDDTLSIHGGNPKAAHLDTYGDHRTAMSFAVAGAKLPGMTINDPDVVCKTFPAFWDTLASIGVGVTYI